MCCVVLTRADKKNPLCGNLQAPLLQQLFYVTSDFTIQWDLEALHCLQYKKRNTLHKLSYCSLRCLLHRLQYDHFYYYYYSGFIHGKLQSWYSVNINILYQVQGFIPAALHYNGQFNPEGWHTLLSLSYKGLLIKTQCRWCKLVLISLTKTMAKNVCRQPFFHD